MVCDKCRKNTACYHSTVVINGVAKEEHLCLDCAQLRNSNMFTNSLFDDVFSINPFGFENFAINSKLFNSDNDLVYDAINSINKGAKNYKNYYDNMTYKDKEIKRLKSLLNDAIDKEEYERAQEIKNQIDNLKE